MPEITVSGTEAAFACDENDMIMRAAVRAGLGFPYECNVGSCGNCRFELLSGAVEHLRADAPGWNPRDRARNRYLGCQARPLADCRIKVGLGERYRSLHRPQRTKAHLVETCDLTHDMREFHLKLETPVPFLPGQYALLALPGVEGARAYSMCNTGAAGEEWHFQIKRVPGGAATTRLFESFVPGDALMVDGPYGMAYLREDAPRDVLCLAGGSGLSPMISIARGAAASPQLGARAVHFLYGGRTPRDICGEAIVQALPGYGQRVFYEPVVSSGEAGAWRGRVGLLPDMVRDLFVDRLASFEIYFAGPPAMTQALLRMFHEMKVPPEQIHYDQFC